MAYGLEIKENWSQVLLSGKKTQEARRYTLPQGLLDRRIWLLATNGQPGVGALEDTVRAGQADVSIVGWVTFASVTHFTSRDAWAAAADCHCVVDDSPYGWREDCIGMFGWNVSHVHQLPVAIQVPNAKRIERSIYALSTTDIALDLEGDAAAKMHNT